VGEPLTPATDGAPSTQPTLVLASASPRRAALLARLGTAAAIRPADVDETPRAGEGAGELALRLAAAKAAASAALGRGDEVVLGADTVVAIGGGSLGKPRDRRDAAVMLALLSGRTHEVVTGLAVQRGELARQRLVSTRVTFRPLTNAEIAWYVATGESDDKAGAYGLQGAAAALIERIEGSDTNVVGLPLTETVELLREVGLDLLSPGRPTG
jgi:septum formation protein